MHAYPEPLDPNNATPYNDAIRPVAGPVSTPLPASRNEAVQIHTNVMHATSWSLPFTVSLLYVLFGFFREIALNRVSPSVTCQTVASVVASPSGILTYFTGLRVRIRGASYCTETVMHRYQRKCVPTRAWTL